jgi:hypothetical protein
MVQQLKVAGSQPGDIPSRRDRVGTRVHGDEVGEPSRETRFSEKEGRRSAAKRKPASQRRFDQVELRPALELADR